MSEKQEHTPIAWMHRDDGHVILAIGRLVCNLATSDDIDAIREWMRATDPEGFGCACEPAVICGTCRMRFRHSVLRNLLGATEGGA